MAQSSESGDPVITIRIPLSKYRAIDEALQKYPEYKKLSDSQSNTITELKDALADEKKTNELNQREIYLLNKQLELANKETEIERRTSDRLKEVTDRAIKLVEVSKPKSNWQLQGLLGLAAVVVGVLIAK